MDFVEETTLGEFHNSQSAAARVDNRLHKVGDPATQHRHCMSQSTFDQNTKKERTPMHPSTQSLTVEMSPTLLSSHHQSAKPGRSIEYTLKSLLSKLANPIPLISAHNQ